LYSYYQILQGQNFHGFAFGRKSYFSDQDIKVTMSDHGYSICSFSLLLQSSGKPSVCVFLEQ